MPADDMERLQTRIAQVNELLRRKGGQHLQVRAIWDEKSGEVWIRTDMVEDDGTRHRRQESPPLTPAKALDFVDAILRTLQKS